VTGGPGADRAWVDEMAQVYQSALVPAVFRPFARDLARRAVENAPRRVLELAAGTGALTSELAAAGMDVLATDLNPPMVEQGRLVVPGARWQQADAMALPFADATFDLVVCQFGVMFFPDRVDAYAQARRVLADDGRFLFNTWDSIDTHGWEREVDGAMRRIFRDDPPTFLATLPHGYADPERVLADVRAAGFADVQLETVTMEGTAASIRDLVAGYCRGTPLRAQIEARGDLDATAEALAAELTAAFGAGPATVRMNAHVVMAR
jgi:ubiquinone/menaquinone biosynthesis C-methylase UbiE